MLEAWSSLPLPLPSEDEELDHERFELYKSSGLSERTEGKRKGKGRGKVRRPKRPGIGFSYSSP
jgi:hypothetical protein